MGHDSFEVARVHRTREQARRNYERISRWYDFVEGFWEKRARLVGLARLAPSAGEKILEPGFGTGHSLRAIAEAVGEGGRVYGIELSPRMLQLAQSRLVASGLASRAELVLGDATRLPYGDAAMDAVFMSFTLELFDTPEIPLVLAECRRVLSPGGRICVVALSKAGPSQLMRRLYEWGHSMWPALLDCRPIFVDHCLREAKFIVRSSYLSTIWGLPVETVVAYKPDTVEGEAG